MNNLLNVTTFNTLNNPSRKEERVWALFEELKTHKTDIALLQEVLLDTLPIIKEVAKENDWYVTSGAIGLTTHPDKISGNVTLSRTPAVAKWEIDVQRFINIPTIKPLVTQFENGVTAFNVHLPWGGNAELRRLETLYTIDKAAQLCRTYNKDEVIVLGGDFNTLPQSDSIRFLDGLGIYKDTSTFWTSAWTSENIYPTARKEGGWAEMTAASVGITDPMLMPTRTIDYLYTYGWNFGKFSYPHSVKKFGESTLTNGFGLSDHYGLTASITI